MQEDEPVSCPIPQPADLHGVDVVELVPTPSLPDHNVAQRLGEHMLLSWHDRDRDFEAPQHVSECHQIGAVPGYVDYALYRGANLKSDIERGRFVFFFLGLDSVFDRGNSD
jgi:hypothetical protein